jgi:DNA polymerase-1
LRENSFEFPVPERTDSGQPSSGKSSLKRFIHYEPKNEWQETGLEFIDLLLHYKKISKLKSSFVTGLREEVYDDGRVHPTFNVLAAKSGRATSSSPNAQQLPDQKEKDKYKIRSLFVADKGKEMLAFDFSNLEVRILCHFSKDKKLMRTFEEGHDSHGATAVNVLGLDCHPDEAKKLYPTERNIGKTLNFAQQH